MTHHDSLNSLTRTDSCSIGLSRGLLNQSPRQLSSVRQSIFRSNEEAEKDTEMLKGIKLSTDNLHGNRKIAIEMVDDELVYRNRTMRRQ